MDNHQDYSLAVFSEHGGYMNSQNRVSVFMLDPIWFIIYLLFFWGGAAQVRPHVIVVVLTQTDTFLI